MSALGRRLPNVTGRQPSRPLGTHSVLAIAAWHSLAWLFVANLIGVWLAILLLFPAAGRWLGEWSYGRWTPVHLNFQLYGWMALPLVAWAIRIYRADRGPIATWSRAALFCGLSLSPSARFPGSTATPAASSSSTGPATPASFSARDPFPMARARCRLYASLARAR